MPFITGVHTSCLVALESMPLEETVFVDLDANTVVGLDDMEILPPSIVAMKSRIRNYNAIGKSACITVLLTW